VTIIVETDLDRLHVEILLDLTFTSILVPCLLSVVIYSQMRNTRYAPAATRTLLASLLALTCGAAPVLAQAAARMVPRPPAAALAPNTVLLEDLTWTELRDLIKAGKTTVIVPVGAVEQSGPFLALGKHDVRAKALSEQIARELGNALVAPVVAYTPDGSINPPSGHMRFPGTVSIPSDVFRKTLQAIGLSLAHAGFNDVVFIGDHGGYQADLKTTADDLNRTWAKAPVKAHYVADYYRATQIAYVESLKMRGFTPAQIGTHAGLADTSLTLAVDPRMVRADALLTKLKPTQADGVYGDPRRASAGLGQLGVNEIVRQTVAAIRAAVRRP
jgi:creatinine amidohydrolase